MAYEIAYTYFGKERPVFVVEVADTPEAALAVFRQVKPGVPVNEIGEPRETLTEIQREREARKERNAQVLYDDLRLAGFPDFSLTENEHYETSVFVLNSTNRSAYETLYAHVIDNLALLAAGESDSPVFGRLGFDVWASPSTFDDTIIWLESLGVVDAARRIKVGQNSHGVKVNLCLPNSLKLVGLDIALQTNFKHVRACTKGRPDLRTIQIGKRNLLEQFIRDGILPEEIQ
jgi:hypothetical protein